MKGLLDWKSIHRNGPVTDLQTCREGLGSGQEVDLVDDDGVDCRLFVAAVVIDHSDQNASLGSGGEADAFPTAGCRDGHICLGRAVVGGVGEREGLCSNVIGEEVECDTATSEDIEGPDVFKAAAVLSRVQLLGNRFGVAIGEVC